MVPVEKGGFDYKFTLLIARARTAALSPPFAPLCRRLSRLICCSSLALQNEMPSMPHSNAPKRSDNRSSPDDGRCQGAPYHRAPFDRPQRKAMRALAQFGQPVDAFTLAKAKSWFPVRCLPAPTVYRRAVSVGPWSVTFFAVHWGTGRLDLHAYKCSRGLWRRATCYYQRATYNGHGPTRMHPIVFFVPFTPTATVILNGCPRPCGG